MYTVCCDFISYLPWGPKLSGGFAFLSVSGAAKWGHQPKPSRRVLTVSVCGQLMSPGERAYVSQWRGRSVEWQEIRSLSLYYRTRTCFQRCMPRGTRLTVSHRCTSAGFATALMRQADPLLQLNNPFGWQLNHSRTHETFLLDCFWLFDPVSDVGVVVDLSVEWLRG